MGGQERAKPALAGYGTTHLRRFEDALRTNGFQKCKPDHDDMRFDREERPSISPAMHGTRYAQSWGGEMPITIVVDTMAGKPGNGRGSDFSEILFRFKMQNAGRGALVAPLSFPNKALSVSRESGEMVPDSRYHLDPSKQIYLKASESIIVAGTVAAYPSNASALASIKPELEDQAKTDSSMPIHLTAKDARDGGSGRNVLLIDPDIIDPVRYTELMLYIISKITGRIVSMGSEREALRGADAIDMLQSLSKVPVDKRNSFSGWLDDMKDQLSMKLKAIASTVGSDRANSVAMDLLADKSI